MNPLYQQLQNRMQSQMGPAALPQSNSLKSSTQALPQRNNLLSQFLNSSSPESFIQNMAKNNPQLQNVLQLFNNSNLTPKQFFYQYAQQQGIDPNQFLNSFVNNK